jgi:presenilin-like A22 family membrane protease
MAMKLTRPHLSLLGIFLFSHIVGILAGYQYQQTALSQGTAVVNQQASSGFYLFGLILVATLLMILLYKFDFQRIIKLWFLSAIFITILLFFLAFFPPFLALGFAVAGFIVRKLVPDLWTRNLIDSLSYAGAGALFGAMIGVIPALILLGVLSLYDILSVFWTKHMVSLVKAA